MIEWKKEIIGFKLRIINARPHKKVNDGNIYQNVAVIYLSKRNFISVHWVPKEPGRERRRGAFYV